MTDTPADLITAAVLVIGDEVLSGRTADKNMGWLATELGQRGIQVHEMRVVRDDFDQIGEAVRALSATYTYVFTTGGIGPTHDDITAEAIARAFGVALERNPEAVARLEAHYPPGELTEARLRMANIPAGARLIDNPVSGAPGFILGNVHVMAGVPKIMNAMFLGLADHLAGGLVLQSLTVTCLIAESKIAALLGALQDANPTIAIGSYPFFDGEKGGARVVLRGPDLATLTTVADAVVTGVSDMGAMARLEPVTA